MIKKEGKTILVETPNHIIEISEDALAINTQQPPNSGIKLNGEETKELLEALLVWQYGLETVLPNDPDA